MSEDQNKFFVSQRTLVIMIIIFVFLVFASIIIKAVLSGHI